nr:hypothetical protein [Tanacetum cinerariifolium]
KLFDDEASRDGQGADIQPVIATTNTIVEDVASLQPRRQRKGKTVVADASGPSHPPKKIREDYAALGGAFAAEAAEAICLWAEVFKFKATEKSLQVKVKEQEVADLDAQVTAVKLQNDHIVDQVHEVEISSIGLKEKVAAYEGFIGQLEKFQDKKWRRCLNSTEYMSALRAAISKAVEKGMQEGLFAGITHGVEGRKLADVTAYDPSAKADYLSALERLQNVNFSLIEELKSNKDATDGSYPPFSGSTRRSRFCFILSLDVSYSRVKKIRENIASHVSALHGVFVPLSEPLSIAALEGTEGGADVDGETTAVRNINLFSDVSNTELNILE